MSPPQMELSDKRAKILLGLGATQVIIGILEVLFNIGANVMFAHVVHYTGAGYWCGAFVSHGFLHYSYVIMGTMACQITSLTLVYSTVYSGADQRKHQSSASLAFVWGIHRWPANSPHKGPVTRLMFPFDDVNMLTSFHIHDRHKSVNGTTHSITISIISNHRRMTCR